MQEQISLPAFFGLIFGARHGYVAIRTWPGGKFGQGPGPTHTTWFHWPSQQHDMIGFCLANDESDVYFIPALFETPTHCRASNIKHQMVTYADADTCQPDVFRVTPSIVVETSPGKHHTYWIVHDTDESQRLTQVGRSIAHAHADDGCDLGGWDATQLLRVPMTTNNKERESGPFMVNVAAFTSELFSIDDLVEAYPPLQTTIVTQEEMPPMSEWISAGEALNSLFHHLDLMPLYSQHVPEPTSPADTPRHRRMWRFLCEMSRRGIDRKTAMVLAWYSGCNKYRQDGRPPEELWRELCKAFDDPDNHPPTDEHGIEKMLQESAQMAATEINGYVQPFSPSLENSFLTMEERVSIDQNTIIDRYVAWAHTKTDAALQYHRAGIMTVLSAVFGEYGKAPVFDMALNLWFLVLGPTTRSRKSTAQGMWLKLVHYLEDERFSYDLTSNTTPEALIDELLDRPGQSSIFHRDEVHGLMNEQASKRYLAGLKEDLTALFDGRVPKKLRVGRASVHRGEVRTNFIMNFTGITDDVTDNLTARDFGSGYLARFLFVNGAPPERTKEGEYLPQHGKEGNGVDPEELIIVESLKEAREFWDAAVERGNPMAIYYEDDAWERWNQFAWDIGDDASKHELASVLAPVADRLSKAIIKVGCLLAMAEKQRFVTMRHLLKAISLSEEWYHYALYMASKVQESQWQRQQDEILVAIGSLRDGMTDAQILRKFRGKIPVRDLDTAMEVLKRAGLIMQIQGTGKSLRWVRTGQ